ncbi:hypothetical protein FHT05_003367 [Xanthomonas arboricola]|uniref:hypothetical protein n=1 Tax=Xanthomonas arboricola TaxID=56448 RepID=UPI00182FE0A5|nr:hypothetical protein [Xanthomonas arboricola]MBB6258744.1 hypothetical protein [Xanthomonas arboricola]
MSIKPGRQQGALAQLDALRLCRQRIALPADAGDTASDDLDLRLLQIAAGLHIQQARSSDDGGLCVCAQRRAQAASSGKQHRQTHLQHRGHP